MDDNKRRRSMLLYVLIAIVLYLVVSGMLYPSLLNSQTTKVSYSEFKTMVSDDEVTNVSLNTSDSSISFTTGSGDSTKYYTTTLFPDDTTLTTLLDDHNVTYGATVPDNSSNIWLYMLISYGLPLILILWFGWWLNRQMKKQMGDDGPSMNFGSGGFGGMGGGGLGKSNAKEVKGEETGVTFKDVAGHRQT